MNNNNKNETKEGKGVSTQSYLKKKNQADSQEIVTGIFSFSTFT